MRDDSQYMRDKLDGLACVLALSLGLWKTLVLAGFHPGTASKTGLAICYPALLSALEKCTSRI